MVELVVALAVTVGTAPLVRRALVAWNVLDVPNARSSHETPVARGGGIACALGVSAGLVAAQVSGHPVPWAVWAVAMAVAGVGLLDDILSLPAGPRLVAQALAGAVLGVVLQAPWIATAVAAGAMVLAVNVVNFMDGVNGISAGTVAVWAGSVAVVGAVEHDRSLGVLGLATAAAALGFMPFNVPVARLFLGDSGSYLFGALVAGGVVLAWRHGTPVLPLVAPLGLYVGDVIFTLARRAREGQPLMRAHRDHVYQRLVPVWGGSHLRVGLLATAGAAVLAGVAWLPLLPSVVLIVAVVACYLALPRWVRGAPWGTGVGARDA